LWTVVSLVIAEWVSSFEFVNEKGLCKEGRGDGVLPLAEALWFCWSKLMGV
jgi:hypothetical protein